jgi:uncharacterized protein
MISDEVAMKKYEHWKLIGTLLWGCVIFLFVQIGVTALIVLTKATDYSAAAINEITKSIEKNGMLLSIFVIAMMILGLVVISLIIKFKKNSNLIDYLAINKIPYQAVLHWIGLAVGYIALAEAIRLLLGEPMVTEFMSTIYKTASPIWMLWLALIVAAPIFEEVFFRGFLYKGLAASPVGTIGAILFTSAAWTVIHTQYGYIDMSIIFFLGILLGYARFKSNSILVPIAMHSVINLLATIQAAIW